MNKYQYNASNTYSFRDILAIFNATRADIELWVKYYEFPKAVHCFNNRALYSKTEVSKWAEGREYVWKKKVNKR